MWKDKHKITAQRSTQCCQYTCVWFLYVHFVSCYSKSWCFFNNNFDRPYIKSCHVEKICALLRFYATYRGSFFPELPIPSSRVKHPRNYLTFEYETDTMSGNVGNYHLYAAWNPKIAQNSFAARTKTEITHSLQSFKKCQVLQNRCFFYRETGK